MYYVYVNMAYTRLLSFGLVRALFLSFFHSLYLSLFVRVCVSVCVRALQPRRLLNDS